MALTIPFNLQRCIFETILSIYAYRFTVWLSDNIDVRIAELYVKPRTVIRRTTDSGDTVLVYNQTTQANSAWPSFRG